MKELLRIIIESSKTKADNIYLLPISNGRTRVMTYTRTMISERIVDCYTDRIYTIPQSRIEYIKILFKRAKKGEDIDLIDIASNSVPHNPEYNIDKAEQRIMSSEVACSFDVDYNELKKLCDAIKGTDGKLNIEVRDSLVISNTEGDIGFLMPMG